MRHVQLAQLALHVQVLIIELFQAINAFQFLAIIKATQQMHLHVLVHALLAYL